MPIELVTELQSSFVFSCGAESPQLGSEKSKILIRNQIKLHNKNQIMVLDLGKFDDNSSQSLLLGLV